MADGFAASIVIGVNTSGSIDPMYYDASYFVAPDGKAGTDVYAVLREAIAKTGKTALARVVIAQRERTIALRPRGEGLMAHTLYEDRDLNSSKELFDDLVARRQSGWKRASIWMDDAGVGRRLGVVRP